MSKKTAKDQGIVQGEWVEVENTIGKIIIQVAIRDDMPDDLVRIPHGWWKPEEEQGAAHLSGALNFADAQLCPDDDDYLDREQGIPHLKGIPCRINKVSVSQVSDR